RIVEKAIDQQADQIIPDTDQVRLSVAERRAAALITICNHSLYRETTTRTASDSDSDPDSDSEPVSDLGDNAGMVHTITATPPVELTITVDARTAASTNGQTGIAVLNGPRIGTKALEAILCDSIIDVIAISEQGRPLALGKNTRVIPRKLRKHILSRDQGCASDGCPSKHHLQIHHIIPISQGGLTLEQNLITLCWYHHQIAIHQQGLQVQKLGPSRIRLVPPPNGTDPPHTRRNQGRTTSRRPRERTALANYAPSEPDRALRTTSSVPQAAPGR
ncbi:MAG: HNH endonuclease signature motif containing protein, partial [Acidimicrobiia bacterium]